MKKKKIGFLGAGVVAIVFFSRHSALTAKVKVFFLFLIWILHAGLSSLTRFFSITLVFTFLVGDILPK